MDGTGADSVPNAAIVLREGRIAAVGPREAVEIPSDSDVIDVSGMRLLPGLVNTHVHDVYDARVPEGWAQGGVTTVRDLGARTGSSNELEVLYALADATRNEPRCARLVGASPMLTTPGGHGYLGVASREEGEAEVARLLEAGADLIKIGIEDRLATRSWPLIPQDIVEGIVEAAHARGAWDSAHMSRASHVQMALDAGVDELGHMIYDEPPAGLIERVADAGVVWIPTLDLWHGVDRRHGTGYGPSTDANRAGGTVALGTDYGGYQILFDLGTPLTEVRWMLAAGMTPMEVLVVATRDAAFVCGLEDEVGTLEVGKAADLIAIGGDPLADLVGALRDLRLVVRNGFVIRDDRTKD